jgi:wobble nucleotide-excising tRNase
MVAKLHLFIMVRGMSGLERIRLLRNVGQFDSVDAGGQLSFSKLSLVYAENGRGKTTLAAILRSLSTGDPLFISERHRLPMANEPHVVIGANGASYMFKDGAWSASLPDVAVFDDVFVAQNVCSGIDVQTEHRQNLHELILGAQGVSLDAALRTHVTSIEEHNRELRRLGDAIPGAARGSLSVEEFCSLEPDANISRVIENAERSLAAAKSAEAVRQRQEFHALRLPEFDTEAIDATLQLSLPNLEAKAAARVQAHVVALGQRSEEWIGDGMRRIAAASAREDHDVCPFCAQDLRSSPLIDHYRAYFSDAYTSLKGDVAKQIDAIDKAHGHDIPAAFERAVRVAVEGREFWRSFTGVPDIELDTAAIARAWKSAREGVLASLRAKQAAPLEAISLSERTRKAIVLFHDYVATVHELSNRLQQINPQIAVVKEQAAAANVATITRELARLKAIQTRHDPAVEPLCGAYLDEKRRKTATEALRDQARTALDSYRQTIFPAYETAINAYLLKFNAGFSLGSVCSTNTRGGSSCTYNVVINSVPVSLTAGAGGGPAFRNTLSSGDRNTLALAFFFASLDRDPHLARKIVIIDDPMTSLDEHRSLTTIQEMRRLTQRVSVARQSG